MRRRISREVNLMKFSALLRPPTRESSLRWVHLTWLVDKSSFRTTWEVANPAYSFLSAPPSLVATFCYTRVDTIQRAKVHPYNFLCLFVCVLFARHYAAIRSALPQILKRFIFLSHEMRTAFCTSSPTSRLLLLIRYTGMSTNILIAPYFTP